MITIVIIRALHGAAVIAAYSFFGAVHIVSPVVGIVYVVQGSAFAALSFFGAVDRAGTIDVGDTCCRVVAVSHVSCPACLAFVGVLIVSIVVIFDSFNCRISSCIVDAGCAADGAESVLAPVVDFVFGEAAGDIAV